MNYFTAIYQMPAEGLQEWMTKPEEERKEAEKKMKGEWGAWLAAHKDSVLNTIGLGQTKTVAKDGIKDTKNGMMLSSYVQAETLGAAAEIFRDHPHLQIPGAFIEVMATKQI